MEGHVRKRGSKWYYSFEAGIVDGKRKRIERVGGRTKKEAESALRKAIQEFENAGSHFEPSEISVSDYMDYWMKNYVEVNCKYNTISGYEGIIKNHIKPALGIYKLKSLTPSILQEFVNKKFLSGVSKNYLQSMIGVLSGSFKYAVHPCNFLKDNPMQYVTQPKYKHSKKVENRKALTQSEFNKIIERFPQGSSFYIPLQIAFHTGTRVSECCGLTWDRIDLENKYIYIERILIKKDYNQWYFGTPKTESSTRKISIGNTLVNILKQHRRWQLENQLKYGEYYTHYYLDKNDRVTNNTAIEQIQFICTKENGELITPDSIKYCSRVINKELKIQFNFHALRHTHATLLIENGANMKDVQERLGHSKLATTMDTYTHVTEKMSKGTVDIFERTINSNN